MPVLLLLYCGRSKTKLALFLILKISNFFFEKIRIYALKVFTDFENKPDFQNGFTNGFRSQPLYCKNMYGLMVKTKPNRYLHKQGN